MDGYTVLDVYAVICPLISPIIVSYAVLNLAVMRPFAHTQLISAGYDYPCLIVVVCLTTIDCDVVQIQARCTFATEPEVLAVSGYTVIHIYIVSFAEERSKLAVGIIAVEIDALKSQVMVIVRYPARAVMRAKPVDDRSCARAISAIHNRVASIAIARWLQLSCPGFTTLEQDVVACRECRCIHFGDSLPSIRL